MKNSINCELSNSLNIIIHENRIKVLIIGGGKAALIKCNTFLKNGARITLLSLDFSKEIIELYKKNKVKIMHGKFNKDFLNQYHLIIIAIPKEEGQCISDICEKENKLYLTAYEGSKGNFIIPYQQQVGEIKYSVSSGAPMLSRKIGSVINNKLQSYVEFNRYIIELRKRFKGHSYYRELMEFICSDDFLYFYNKGKGPLIIDLFFKIY